jgi:hypothetical protein
MSNARLAETDIGMLTASLNEALSVCGDEVTGTLHLTGFAEVTLDDYRSILEVEQYAVERGYPTLA